jgi:hypothetical protein
VHHDTALLRGDCRCFWLESGLHTNWHRHYDPTLGRYTQPDPLGFVDGPSVYGYAGGNPQALVDPEGESSSLLRPFIRPLLTFCYRTLFSPGSGLLNTNRYLRIGEGRKGGDIYFRIAGDWLKAVARREKMDLWKIRSLNKRE